MVDYVVPGMIDSTAGSLGFRNRIINGGMDVWQRGTSFTNPGSSTTYTADRWSCYRGGYTANATITQVTGLTIGTGINRNALRFQRTSGDANTSPIFVTQSLESINSRDSAGQPVTLSFYVRAGANFSATQLSVVVVSGTGTDEYLRGNVTGYNAFVNSSTAITTSFQRYSFTGTVPSTCNQLSILFGYTPTSTAGAADYFDVTDVQLEIGSIATPFERRPYGMELALCQRYFETSYDPGTAFGTVTTTLVWDTYGGQARNLIMFKVTKRATPTIVAYSYTNGAAGYFGSGSGNLAFNGNAFQNGFNVYTAGAFNGYLGLNYTASAEL